MISSLVHCTVHTDLYIMAIQLSPIFGGLKLVMLQLLKEVTAANQLMDTVLRIGAYDIPPVQFLVTRSDGSFNWTGAIPTIVLGIMDTFKMRYSIVPLNIKEVQKFGTTKAAIRQLIYDEVDVAPGVFVPSMERAEIMEFSFPIAMDTYRLCVPKPSQEVQIFAFIGPFQPTVWLVFFLAMISTVFILSGLTKIEATKSKESSNVKKQSYSSLLNNAFIYVLTTILNQGNWSNLVSFSSRIFLLSWLLAATVLVNSYSGTLISYLTLPRSMNSIKTIEDVAKSSDIKLILGTNTVLSQKILNASSGVYKVLGDKIRQNPSSLVLSANDLYSKLETKGYAFPIMETVCFNFMEYDFNKTGECRFEVSPTIPISQFGTIGLKKGSKYNQILSYRLLQFWESGIVQREFRSTYSKGSKCLLKTKLSARPRQIPIKLIDLSSAFLLLGIGIVVSVFSFMAELIFKKYGTTA